MTAPVQPVTFYVPASASEPMEVRVAHSGLRMVLVNRESVRLLGAEWKVLGIYFLLGPADNDPDHFRAYVGEVGRRDLLTRLTEHVAQKPWWSRALLIASEATDGFNSAEIGWLEGRLYDVLNNAVAAELMNRGRPGDDSIALKDRGVLERYVEPTMAALRACGAPPDTADQKPAPKGKRRALYRESVKDLIDAGLLKAGTRLKPLRKHLTKTAMVLADGSLEVDGVSYQAVSTAAVAVSANKSEPGWEFWGAPSGDGSFVPLFKLRSRLRADQATAALTPAAGQTGTGPNLPAGGVPQPGGAGSAPGPVSVIPARGKRRFDESVKDLIDAGLLSAGEELLSTRRRVGSRATVLADGTIQLVGTTYTSLSTAAKAASGSTSEPGWEFWSVKRDGGVVRLFQLREELRRRRSGG